MKKKKQNYKPVLMDVDKDTRTRLNKQAKGLSMRRRPMLRAISLQPVEIIRELIK